MRDARHRAVPRPDARSDGTICAMSDDDRTLTVTDDLLRAMVADATALLLRSRRVWFGYVACVVAAVAAVVLLVAPDTDPTAYVLLAGAVVLPVAQMAAQRRAVRRVLTAAMPPGAVLTVRLTPDELHVEGALGGSRTVWHAYRGVRERGSVLLLRQVGTGVERILPRALFDDTDHARIRELVG